jgi:hypothetical protein
MTDSAPCCEQIRAATPAPFEVIELDYCDGVTEGLARCRTCGRTYHLALLCVDAGTSRRVYGFARLGTDDYARGVAAASAGVTDVHVQSERNLIVISEDIEQGVLCSGVVEFASWLELLQGDINPARSPAS